MYTQEELLKMTVARLRKYAKTGIGLQTNMPKATIIETIIITSQKGMRLQA